MKPLDQSLPTTGLASSESERLLNFQEKFISFIERKVSSREIAEDIFQTALLRAVERGGALREKESIIAWFYRILRNAIVDHYRSKTSTSEGLKRLAIEMQSDQYHDPEFANVACGCVSSLIGNLKPEYQAALQSVDLGEMSVQDFARQSEITPGNAAVRLHRAREALRRQVETACGECAASACGDCDCE